MKRCLACNKSYMTSLFECPNCSVQPAIIDGFDSYAPQYAHEGGGFKKSYFAKLAQLEERHFWFQSRNKIILWAIKKYCQDFNTFLEVGCGTGFVLSGVASEYSQAKLYGSEIFTAGLGFAKARVQLAQFIQMDARNIPFNAEFDVIGAFDVLEHIKEDDTVLTQIHRALNPSGLLLLTVPQHEWLWSPVDEYACHERRYCARDLHQKMTNAGFQIIKSTSFITLLLPAMLFSRFVQKKRSLQKFDAAAELKIASGLNVVFSHILSVELRLLKAGLNFPIGGSRLVVAKKV